MSAPGPLWNPPARPELSWRLGRYADILARMRAAGPLFALPDGSRPLAGWNTGAPEDFGVALAGAWAVAADVLCFYQERLLNEGFLRTATEPLSIRELVRALGYRPNPGVGASTMLAFVVGPGIPGDGASHIPAGTAAQSAPVGGGVAQTFETSVDVWGRPEWNAMPPYLPVRVVRPFLASGASRVRLAGQRTGVAAGDGLLLDDAAGSAWSFALASAAAPDRASNSTAVTLGEPAAGGVPGALAVPRVTAFGRRASLFGHDAPAWSAARPEQRRAAMDPAGGLFRLAHGSTEWRGASTGLPMEAPGAAGFATPRAVFASSAGVWLAAVSGQGVYRSDDGAAWAAVGGPLARAEVFCFAEGTFGELYAGGAAGRVYRSPDGGRSWDARLPQPVVQSDGATLTVTSARMPGVIVRSLLAWRDGAQAWLAAGTDAGVYLSNDGGGAWTAQNVIGPPPPPKPPAPPAKPPTLPSTPPAPGLAAFSVFALARGADGVLMAGTSAGVYRAAGPAGGYGWSDVSGTLPRTASLPPTVRTLAAAADPSGGARAYWAGTDAGVFRAAVSTGAWSWAPASSGLGTDGAAPAVRGLVVLGGGVATRVLAATSAGVFVSGDGGRSWSAAAPPPPAPASGAAGEKAAALACDAPPVPAPAGLNNPDVLALAAGPDDSLLAATPFLGYRDAVTREPVTEWPCFAPRGSVLDLAGATRAIVPGSRVVVWQPGAAGATAALCTVDSVDSVRRTDFGLSGAATRLTVVGGGDLGALDPRTAVVFAVPAELPLDVRQVPEPVPVGGGALTLAGAVPALRRRQWIAVTGQPARVALAPAAGVFRGSGGGWLPAGLALCGVRALACGGAGAAWAACEGGVFATTDGGDSWAAVGGALGAVPTSLLRAPGGDLYAGTEGAGVRVSAGGTGTWRGAGPGLDGLCVHALAMPGAGALYAATDGGVFRLAGGAWEPAGSGLPGASMLALAVDQGDVYAAGRGSTVWRLPAGAPSWVRAGAGLPARSVLSLSAGEDGTIFAGTDGGGVYRLAPGGTAWTGVRGLDRAQVPALAVGVDGALWAGTLGGVYRAADAHSAWAPVPVGAANQVQALAIAADGTPWAGCGTRTLLTSADGLQTAPVGMVHAATLDLDVGRGLDAGALPDEARQALTRAGIAVPAIDQVTVRVPRQAWTLATDAGPLFLYAGPGAVQAWWPSETPVITRAPASDGATADVDRAADDPGPPRNPVADDDPDVDPLRRFASATDDDAVAPDEVGDPVDLTIPGGLGQITRVAPSWSAEAIDRDEDAAASTQASPPAGSADAPASADESPDDPGSPADAPDPKNADPGPVAVLSMAVRTGSGFAGQVQVRADEWFWRPAIPADPAAAEVVRVATAGAGVDRTQVTVSPALAGLYDPATTTVCANVAPATQGASVGRDVLGSGDATAVGQQFRLHRQPLAYVPADTPTGGASTLQVRVDGAAWTEVETLAGQAPGAAVYLVRVQPDGPATVVFGDGREGARLPTGMENVTATYRTGIGADGNLPSGSITVLRSRPAAVRRAANPVAATGGADPESPDQARERAPVAVRALGRVVSLSDYADFASLYPGVSQARSDLLRARASHLVAVTIAGVEGAVPGAGVMAGLTASIDANRLNATRFRVVPYEPLWFRFAARIVASAAYDPADVAHRARHAMQAHLAFDARGFGVDVRLAELMAALQAVRGVQAVEPSALYVDGLAPALHARLVAAPARVDPGTGAPLAAQILLPHPAGGLSLHPARP